MSEQIKKSYYAIIPANVRYDKKLTPNAKLLYGEITALCNEKGYCWASNSYFAELYEVSNVTISNWIRELREAGYIKSEMHYKDGSKEILNRHIRIVTDPIKENFNTPSKKLNDPIKKNFNTPQRNLYDPIKENFKDNNTVNTTNNNTSNKDILSSSDEHDRIPYKDVIDYLNDKAGRNFKSSANKTKSLIKARWNEGFNLDDFKQVIDTKVNDWSEDKKMFKYLRPETLFGTKFEGYLNERPIVNNQPTYELEWEE